MILKENLVVLTIIRVPLGILEDSVLDKEQSVSFFDKEWSSMECENLGGLFLLKMIFGHRFLNNKYLSNDVTIYLLLIFSQPFASVRVH